MYNLEVGLTIHNLYCDLITMIETLYSNLRQLNMQGNCPCILRDPQKGCSPITIILARTANKQKIMPLSCKTKNLQAQIMLTSDKLTSMGYLQPSLHHLHYQCRQLAMLYWIQRVHP